MQLTFTVAAAWLSARRHARRGSSAGCPSFDSDIENRDVTLTTSIAFLRKPRRILGTGDPRVSRHRVEQSTQTGRPRADEDWPYSYTRSLNSGCKIEACLPDMTRRIEVTTGRGGCSSVNVTETERRSPC
jgi:hypothetical protein